VARLCAFGKVRTALLQSFNFFEQPLLEAVQCLATLGVASLVSTPDQVTAYADSLVEHWPLDVSLDGKSFRSGQTHQQACHRASPA
jgi:hypothetical protein